MEKMETAEAVAKLGRRSPRSLLIELLRFFGPLLILIASIAFFVKADEFKKTDKKAPEEVLNPRVDTQRVEEFASGMRVIVDGFAVPYREMTLSSQVMGRVMSKSDHCLAGRFVKAGTLLLEIDPADYKIELKRLKQELRQAEIAVHEIDVQLENLDRLGQLAEQDRTLQSREVNRLRSLAGERIVAQSDVDRAKSSEILSRNSLQQLANETRTLTARRASLQAAVELAKTKVERAELDLKRTRIYAPVDGVVVDDRVEENTYVQPGAALVQFEDTSAVEVKCNLKSEALSWITCGNSTGDSKVCYEVPKVPARVILERDGQEYVWEGVLSRFDGLGMDEMTRMFPCRVLVDEPTGGQLNTETSLSSAPVPTLVRGMYVRVELEAPNNGTLAEIPENALRLGNVVWRVDDERLEVVPVKVAQRLTDSIVIDVDASGLRIGDQVVTSPLTAVSNGMQVRMFDEPQAEVTTVETAAEQNQERSL